MAHPHRVALLGGLGNQLFQVAFAEWLTEQSGIPVKFELSSMVHTYERGINYLVAHSFIPTAPWTGYLPGMFGRWAALGTVARAIVGPTRIVTDQTAWGPDCPETTTPAWWTGYWQRTRFSDRLARLICAAHPLSSSSAVGLHVRRGDMKDKRDFTPERWFPKAVDHALSGHYATTPNVRVWSDDPNWCRSHLAIGVEFEVEEQGSAVEDLLKMASCRTLIISRSTFSWWAGRLVSELGGRVIYPYPWWSDAPPNARGDSVPHSWEQVDLI